ncbi:BrnT family toxin [Acidisoma sp. 7E03]
MTDRSDPAKDALNRARHQVSLAFGDEIFRDERHLILPTIRAVDGEDRHKVIGLVAGKLYTGVFVWRATGPRFISVRRSNSGEERAYRAAS